MFWIIKMHCHGIKLCTVCKYAKVCKCSSCRFKFRITLERSNQSTRRNCSLTLKPSNRTLAPSMQTMNLYVAKLHVDLSTQIVYCAVLINRVDPMLKVLNQERLATALETFKHRWTSFGEGTSSTVAEKNCLASRRQITLS